MTKLNAAQETKIELLIEAIEGFVETRDGEYRKELHDRLREFLLPAVRIIDGGEQAAHPDINVVCLKCGRKRQCLDYGIGGCPDWAASIKAYYTDDNDGGAVA
jgi:hypothetical protein